MLENGIEQKIDIFLCCTASLIFTLLILMICQADSAVVMIAKSPFLIIYKSTLERQQSFLDPLPFIESVVEKRNVISCSFYFCLYKCAQHNITGVKIMFNQHTILLFQMKHSILQPESICITSILINATLGKRSQSRKYK